MPTFTIRKERTVITSYMSVDIEADSEEAALDLAEEYAEWEVDDVEDNVDVDYQVEHVEYECMNEDCGNTTDNEGEHCDECEASPEE